MDLPKAGDRVRIPWGLDVLDGLVLDVSGTGAGGRAVVQVDLPGTADSEDEPTTVSLPLSALQPADWWPDASEPTGSWATRAGYERHVVDAIKRIAANYSDIAVIGSESLRDSGYDLLLRSPRGIMLVETQYFARSSAGGRRARDLAFKLRRAFESVHDVIVMLLVTNVDMTRSAIELQLREQASLNIPIRMVTWRSREDDGLLATEIEHWLVVGEQPRSRSSRR